MRILITGVGNVLRGDDGFGIEVLRQVQALPTSLDITYFESGIAGISLVQQLMDGYDALIIIDALDRGAEPGRVFVLEPDQESLSIGGEPHESTDLHQADPEAVLRMAHELKILPKHVWLVGCQAVGCDDLGAPLSEPVASAVPLAVERVREIISALDYPIEIVQMKPEKTLAAKDELLQVMYWLRGEGLAKEVAPLDLTRWISLEIMQIHSLLVELAESKLVELVDREEANMDAMRFRLTISGAKEGGRRFADEFAEMTKPGHYECSDPNCECKRTGNPADCVSQR